MMYCLQIGLNVVMCLYDRNHICVLEIIWKDLTTDKAAVLLTFPVLPCAECGQVAALVCSPDKARRTGCCLFSDYALWGQCLCMTL